MSTFLQLTLNVFYLRNKYSNLKTCFFERFFKLVFKDSLNEKVVNTTGHCLEACALMCVQRLTPWLVQNWAVLGSAAPLQPPS